MGAGLGRLCPANFLYSLAYLPKLGPFELKVSVVAVLSGIKSERWYYCIAWRRNIKVLRLTAFELEAWASLFKHNARC